MGSCNLQKGSKDFELKKHINAVHCSNNLTLVQRKLVNALLFNAYPELPTKTVFQIKAQRLCELIGYNSNDHAKLKKALRGLMSIVIEWNVTDPETGKENSWKASSIISAAKLENGECRYEYSSVMREFLYKPEMYARLNMKTIARFKSGYSLALYENCIRYQGLPRTPWFPIDTFRKLMGVFEDKYREFYDLNAKVIKVAVKELNAISPIKVVPEFEKMSRKVTHIRFNLSRHGEQCGMGADIDKSLIERLSDDFQLKKGQISELLEKHEESYIKEKVGIILDSESFRSGAIRDLAAYLIDALRKDYKHSKSSKKLIAERRSEQKKVESDRTLKAKGLDARYNAYISKKIKFFITSLAEPEKKELLKAFEQYIKEQGGWNVKWFKKHGLEHPAIKSLLNKFIRETQKASLGTLLEFEEYFELLQEELA